MRVRDEVGDNARTHVVRIMGDNEIIRQIKTRRVFYRDAFHWHHVSGLFNGCYLFYAKTPNTRHINQNRVKYLSWIGVIYCDVST